MMQEETLADNGETGQFLVRRSSWKLLRSSWVAYSKRFAPRMLYVVYVVLESVETSKTKVLEASARQSTPSGPTWSLR